ncbi:unnamed protein product, partial [Symbiodinium microadriaticum]
PGLVSLGVPRTCFYAIRVVAVSSEGASSTHYSDIGAAAFLGGSSDQLEGAAEAIKFCAEPPAQNSQTDHFDEKGLDEVPSVGEQRSQSGSPAVRIGGRRGDPDGDIDLSDALYLPRLAATRTGALEAGVVGSEGARTDVQILKARVQSHYAESSFNLVSAVWSSTQLKPFEIEGPYDKRLGPRLHQSTLSLLHRCLVRRHSLMAMRLLLSLFVGLVPLLVAEVCDTGDVACAARAGALLQRKSRQQQAPVSTGEESLYGSGSMMIEGKFHYVYDPQQYLGKSEDELLRAQEAIQEALAESVGFGLVAAEIQVRFDLAAALAQVSNATPTTLDMVCTFTFPCPAGATPEEVTTSMRTITTRSFLSILAPKLAGLGHEPFAFTATAFMGAAVVTTASPSPTNSTTSFIPIASTLPATTTTEAPKMDFHPCKSLEDYMPEAKMSEYGWCNVEGKTTPSESECLAANCSAHGYPDHPHCHCATEEGCALIGSTWKYHLCKEEMRMYQQGEIYTLWEEAKALGTCNGVVTSWHSTLPESMDWPARKCCASWPQTFCDPADTLATPCKDASDFLADHVTDDGVTCMDWLQQWWSEYWALKNASAAGSCSGMDLPWGESLQDWVTHPAKQCCASFPATICDKDAKFMTPCKVAADFMPEQELYSYCDFEPKLDNVTCEATGCTYYQSGRLPCCFVSCSCRCRCHRCAVAVVLLVLVLLLLLVVLMTVVVGMMVVLVLVAPAGFVVVVAVAVVVLVLVLLLVVLMMVVVGMMVVVVWVPPAGFVVSFSFYSPPRVSRLCAPTSADGAIAAVSDQILAVSGGSEEATMGARSEKDVVGFPTLGIACIYLNVSVLVSPPPGKDLGKPLALHPAPEQRDGALTAAE